MDTFNVNNVNNTNNVHHLHETNVRAQRLSPVSRLAQVSYALGAMLLAVCVVMQMLFAGLGALVSPDYWDWHRGFVSVFQWIPFVMVPAGVVGRLPWRMLAPAGLIIGLITLQYVLVFVPYELGILALRALHAVNALIVWATSIRLVQRAWPLIRTPHA